MDTLITQTAQPATKPSVVQTEIIQPIIQQVRSLYVFAFKKAGDVIAGTLLIVIMALGVLQNLHTPFEWLFVGGFMLTLWYFLEKWLDGDAGLMFAGGLLVMVALVMGLAFAVVGLPMPIVLAICTAFALAGWIMFSIPISIFELDRTGLKALDERFERRRKTFMDAHKAEIDALGRFTFVDEGKNGWTIIDTQRKPSRGWSSEYVCYQRAYVRMLIDQKSPEAQAFKRKQDRDILIEAIVYAVSVGFFPLAMLGAFAILGPLIINIIFAIFGIGQ